MGAVGVAGGLVEQDVVEGREDGGGARRNAAGGVVVRGHIELNVAGETRQLGPGDGYYFRGSLPHRFRNLGVEDCEIVSATSPPPIS